MATNRGLFNFVTKSWAQVRDLVGQMTRELALDPILLLLAAAIAAIGVAAGYSASQQSEIMLERSLVRLSLAFLVMLVIAQLPVQWLFRMAPWLFAVTVLLLIAVWLVGDVGKGAQRWLNLGPIRFQPAEIMKVAAPVMIAWYLAHRPLPPRFFDVVTTLVLVLVPVMLIAIQPDLGSALLILAAGLFTLFFAGLPWRYILGFVLAVLIIAPLLWFFGMRDYQKTRVLTLLDPTADPLGAGYHTLQSMIAIGSGGFWGKGWLEGTQSHLRFLPEGTTDFVLAVYAEEFGFAGLILLFSLYLALIWRGLWIAATAVTIEGRLLAAGISMTLLVYIIVNSGMVLGLLPVVGVPLPLLSYGGTALVTATIALGILMSIRKQQSFLGHER